MLKPSSIAVVAGAFGAVLLVAFFKGSVLGVLIGAMLSPLPLAMAVLGLGTVYLPVAVIGGAVTVLALTGSFVLASVYLMVDAAPVAMLTRFIRVASPSDQGPAIGRGVAALTIGVIVVMLTALVLMPSDAGGIEATLRARLDQLVQSSVEGMSGALNGSGIDLAQARAELVRSMAGLLPGAAAWNWSLRALISAVIGQAMLRRMGLALIETPAYRRFEIPGWFFVVLAGTAGLALLMKGDLGFLAGNAAVALSLPAVLQGLAVVHCAFARFAHPKAGLVVFYSTALLIPTISVVALVVAGVTDHFFKLRGRMAQAQGGQ